MTDRYGLTTISTELHDDGVLVATLNRPEHRNSLDPQMHLELKLLYERIVADEELERGRAHRRRQVLLRRRRLQQHAGQRELPRRSPRPADRVGRAWRATSSRCASR